MRKDFRTALEENIGKEQSSQPRFLEIENHIPADSKVLCSLTGGMFLLLDNGVLSLKLKSMWSGGIGGSELVPLAHIKGVSVEEVAGTFMVYVNRDDTNSKVLAGSSFKTKLFGSAKDMQHAQKFQKLLLGLLGGSSSKEKSSDDPLEKITKLKKLLDSGAITKAEFDKKKKELLDSV